MRRNCGRFPGPKEIFWLRDWATKQCGRCSRCVHWLFRMLEIQSGAKGVFKYYKRVEMHCKTLYAIWYQFVNPTIVWYKSNSFINPSQCFRYVLMPVVSRIHVLSAQSCWGQGSVDCKVVHSKCGQVKAAVIAHLHGIATGMCRRLSAWGRALIFTDGLPGPRLL